MKNGTYGKHSRLSQLARDSQRLSVLHESPLSMRQRFSVACLNKVQALKEHLTKQLAAHYSKLDSTLLRQAVQEADALAATTLFPDLFLPVLAEEKVRSAHAWSRRQKQIQQETISLAT